VIFLINYSNYLSVDEEEFLKNIKTQFEKQNKFYSLIVVVNKLDEMFISECENKSVIRFLDYIRCKLSDLGYKSFIVMGTSARSYFDVVKVCKIDGEVMKTLGYTEPIEGLKGNLLRKRLKTLKNKFIGKPEMSALTFVDDQLEKLECYFGLEDYDLNTLVEKSGMPSLMKYTNFIAIQKANVEHFGLLIKGIDEKFIKIKNNSITKGLIDLKGEKAEQIMEIENMLENIVNSFEYIKEDTEKKLSFKEFEDNSLYHINKFIDNKLKHTLDLCEARADEIFMKLMVKNSDQLKSIKNKTEDIDFLVDNKSFNEGLNKIIENMLKHLNRELYQKEKYIKEAF